jgi:hypothetical protein
VVGSAAGLDPQDMVRPTHSATRWSVKVFDLLGSSSSMVHIDAVTNQTVSTVTCQQAHYLLYQ